MFAVYGAVIDSACNLRNIIFTSYEYFYWKKEEYKQYTILLSYFTSFHM